MLQKRVKELEEIKKREKAARTKVSPQTKFRKKNAYYSEVNSEYEDYDDDSEDNQFDEDEVIKEIKRRYRVPKNIWIVKPGENTNRGNGINVSSNISEIKQLVQKPSANKKEERTYIIQKYIDYPLLIHNRKFDFRCYGILTGVNGFLKGYFYDEAYIRTSCKEFDIDNLQNKYIHLTNDAVQKWSVDYGKYENGNKMSLYDFQKYLKSEHSDLNIDFYQHIMPQI